MSINLQYGGGKQRGKDDSMDGGDAGYRGTSLIRSSNPP